MRQVTRYILIQLAVVTVAVTIALTFAVWLTQSLRLVDLIVNRGLPATTFFSLVGLLLPSFIGIVLPIAFFCAVLFVYNKLIGDSEIVVMRASGLSQLDLARPAIILALALFLVELLINLYALPTSYRAFKDLQVEIRNDHSAVLLQEGVFNTLGDGLTVYVRERTPSGALRGILVHDSRDRKKPVTMMAEEGALVSGDDGPLVVMLNGNRQEVSPDGGGLRLLYFDTYTVEVAQLSEDIGNRWRQPKERFIDELLSPNMNDQFDAKYATELIAEGHQRLSTPLYVFAFAAIGLAALLSGEFSRRGRPRRIVTAVLAVGLLEGAQLAIQDLTVSAPLLSPLMYALPLSVTVGAWWLTVRRPTAKAREPRGPGAGEAAQPA